ncbi:MAG: hypothetical protein KJ002_09945 [Candidatus Dadabacteria bacterium]|nr:hypothetical protein [Candidatus Dadabacteria bacterium]
MGKNGIAPALEVERLEKVFRTFAAIEQVSLIVEKSEDVYDDSFTTLDISDKTLGDYHIKGYSILLNGICRDCRED